MQLLLLLQQYLATFINNQNQFGYQHISNLLLLCSAEEISHIGSEWKENVLCFSELRLNFIFVIKHYAFA